MHSTAAHRGDDRGSALLLAVFILVLLTGLGVAALFVSRIDGRAGQADARAKRAFYLAEAGLESGRERVRASNLTSADPTSLDDELRAAAGGNLTIDFRASNLRSVYDAQGRVTGFTGYGDDVPVAALTALDSGWYAAFLSNDAIDGRTSLDDSNDRVQVTAIGAGSDRSVEVVEAVVERFQIPALPATITLLGPSADFDGGSSNAKIYAGDDCYHSAAYVGIPDLHVPVIGVIGSAAVASASSGVRKPSSYFSGGSTGTATVSDVATTIDSAWLDCDFLRGLSEAVRSIATYECRSTSPCNHWNASTLQTITYVDGDLAGVSGKGILWVTGDVTFRGNDSWDGMIFVVGTGRFERSGGGNGQTIGGTIVANIAGPDGVTGTGDDCTTAPAGFGVAHYDVSGGGTHDSVYCSTAITESTQGLPLRVVSFRER